MRRLVVLFLFTILLFTKTIFLFAQDTPDAQGGIPPFTSYHGGDIDKVSLQNGNLFISIPLFDLPQRGDALKLSFSLVNNNKLWTFGNCQNTVGTPICPSFTTCPPLGVDCATYWNQIGTLSGILLSDDQFYKLKATTGDSGHTYTVSVHGPDGTSHNMGTIAEDLSNVSNPTITAISLDGSGIRYHGTLDGLGTLTLRDGVTTTFGTQGTWVRQDSNGNQITFSSNWQDTLGRVVSTSSTNDFSNCTGPLPIASASVITVPSLSGGSRQFKLCSVTVSLQTNFAMPGRAEYSGAEGVLQSVVLPDGSAWTFEYNSRASTDGSNINFGELTKVTYPTGGSVTYTWGSQRYFSSTVGVTRVLQSRTVDSADGTGGHTWNYSWNLGASPFSVTVSDPPVDGVTTSTTSTLSRVAGLSGPFYETMRQVFQNGTLIQTLSTDYTSDTAPAAVFPVRITTSWPSGQTSKEEIDYDVNSFTYGGAVAKTTTFTPTTPGRYGVRTARREYDFYTQGTTPNLLRQTIASYLWQSQQPYKDANFLDLLKSEVIQDGNGTRVAETDYTYDESQYLTGTSISTQHQTLPPTALRGNETTSAKWLNTTGANLVSHQNWFDTGEPYQASDPLNHSITQTYDSLYAGAYLTQTCSSATGGGTVQHCVNAGYDFNTGLRSSSTDQNGQVTTYVYDPLTLRIKTITLPADPGNGGAHPQISFNYSAPNTFPFTVSRTKSVTPSAGDSVTNTYDGIGRLLKSQHSTPSGVATSDTAYDAQGRIRSTSNPYFATTDSIYGITQKKYDVLNRPTTIIKQDGSQLTIDYSSGNCNTVTDEASNQRRICRDGLDRTIEVDEPGNSFAGSSAAGTLPLNGTLLSTNVGAHSAAPATGQVTINGSEKSITTTTRFCGAFDNRGRCVDWEFDTSTVYDSGTVQITANGHSDQTTFGQGDDVGTIANRLAAVIRANSPYVDFSSVVVNLSANPPTATINLTSRTTGSATNYPLSATVTFDSADFTSGSFATSVSGTNLIGGVDASGGTPVSDSGTVSVSVGSFVASAPYSATPGNSTAALVAAALVDPTNPNRLTRAGSPVINVIVSGSTISMTYATVGSAGNVSVTSTSSSSQPALFPNGSFSGSANLTGGQDSYSPGIAHPYVTQYIYDALSNLLSVTQKGDPAVSSSSDWRIRSFSYDSLSRLLTANNPETHSITYDYDNDGNVLHRTSPAPNQIGTASQIISYCYDELHRMTGKAYSFQNCQGTQLPAGTAAVTYSYDQGSNANGQLTSMLDQSGSGSYVFDPLGRITSEQRIIAGVTKSFGYDYNLDGSLKALHYPSGATVNYTPWQSGAIANSVPSDIKDVQNNINYITSGLYEADGRVTTFTSGKSAAFAGIANTYSYNNRLQPITMSAASPSLGIFSVTYDFHFANGNNGNLFSITNNLDPTRNQTFTYDPLNRLASAQNAGTDCSKTTSNAKSLYWAYNYTYDPWANLTGKFFTKCNGSNLQLIPSSANQLMGYGYDSAGNLLSDPTQSATLTYDPENRIATAVTPNGTYTYAYDGDGNRVSKATGTSGTFYWYGLPGVMAESDHSGNIQAEYIFFNGQRIARRDLPAGSVEYYFSDHLKTASVITDSAGSIKADSDYGPWGEEMQISSSDPNHYKFTGKERDAESQYDYFGARYYSNTLGRFLTPDWSTNPSPIPYADLSDPQSLNLYTYVRNLPTTRFDIDGHKGESGDISALAGDDSKQSGWDKFKKWWHDHVCCKTDKETTDEHRQWLRDHQKTEAGKKAVDKLTDEQVNAIWKYWNDPFYQQQVDQQLIAHGYIPPSQIPNYPAMEKPNVTNAKLQEIVDELFQPTDKVPGGTAGAVRYERITGKLLSAKGHEQEAGELVRRISNFLKSNPGISTNDQNVAKELMNDLTRALAGQ